MARTQLIICRNSGYIDYGSKPSPSAPQAKRQEKQRSQKTSRTSHQIARQAQPYNDANFLTAVQLLIAHCQPKPVVNVSDWAPKGIMQVARDTPGYREHGLYVAQGRVQAQPAANLQDWLPKSILVERK